MYQTRPVVAQPPYVAVWQRGFLGGIVRWLQPSTDAQDLMYRGNPLIGAILTAKPLRLFTFLSVTSILFLLLPSLWAHVALIKDTAGRASRWPWVGFWQRWNWSGMYVLIFPVIFAVTAALSRQCASIFSRLTVPEADGAKSTVTKRDGSRATDFLDSISQDIYRSHRVIFCGILVLTFILTIADVGLLAKGYFQRLVNHEAFVFSDSDWSVAFQLARPRFGFYGWTQRSAWSNLAFDVLAYSAQTLSVFFGFFWIAKYWATLDSFSKQLIDNNIDFQFNPWWSDPIRRMGLLKVGKLFTGFLVVALLFQGYVFGHRLQLIGRAGRDLFEYAKAIKAAAKDPQAMWALREFDTCTVGMWLLLIFVLLPAVVIAWVPLLRFRRYLQRIVKERYASLRADLDKFAEGSTERKILLRQWEEVNGANIWPNGDFAGWIFLSLMVILTIAAWFPPSIGYLVVGGGGGLLLKMLSGFRPKPKAE